MIGTDKLYFAKNNADPNNKLPKTEDLNSWYKLFSTSPFLPIRCHISSSGIMDRKRYSSIPSQIISINDER